MRECWVGANRRAVLVAMALPAVLVGTALLLLVIPPTLIPLWLRLVLALAAVAFGLVLLAQLYLLRQPRLAYEDQHLLVYLQSGKPFRVPIDAVECFFLGQGPTMLSPSESGEETSNIVVRLAESCDEWRHRETRRSLGHWCDGYITIRGTWCEPIDKELMSRLNQRLLEIHRQRKQSLQER